MTNRIYTFYELFQYNTVGIMNVDFYWGVLKNDRSEITRSDTMNIGSIIWDENFDPSLEEN